MILNTLDRKATTASPVVTTIPVPQGNDLMSYCIYNKIFITLSSANPLTYGSLFSQLY